jgi:hypothetical protein
LLRRFAVVRSLNMENCAMKQAPVFPGSAAAAAGLLLAQHGIR